MAKESLVKNAADEGQQAAAKEKLTHSKNREKSDWLAVMQTDAGFRLLTLLMREFHTESNPMGPTDRETYYRIGRQSAGKFIKGEMIKADRRKYFEMELKLGEEQE